MDAPSARPCGQSVVASCASSICPGTPTRRSSTTACSTRASPTSPSPSRLTRLHVEYARYSTRPSLLLNGERPLDPIAVELVDRAKTAVVRYRVAPRRSAGHARRGVPAGADGSHPLRLGTCEALNQGLGQRFAALYRPTTPPAPQPG